MKSDELRRRLNKNRTMVPVSIRMPEDVIEDLKRIAPQLGFSGYQPLIRAYIGQGLRQDLVRLILIMYIHHCSFDESILSQRLREP